MGHIQPGRADAHPVPGWADSAGAATIGCMSRGDRALILATLCIALFLALLDSTAISIIAPQMAGDLNTGVSGLQWTAECYVLAMAGCLLTSGTLGDRLGRKQVFLAGVVLFGAGSALSAMAGSLPLLFAGRAIQGVGAAGMSPQALAIIGMAFPDRAQRARALGIWSGTSGLALLLGPVAGGVLADRFGWQSVFWINVPLTALALALGIARLPATRMAVAHGLDLPGQLLAGVLLVAVSFAVVDAGGSAWHSAAVLAPALLAVAAAAGLVAAERRARDPMLPPALFRSPVYAASVAVLFAVAFGMYASFFLISLELQQVHGLSPAGAGVRFLPAMGTAVVMAPLAGRLAARFGERAVVAAGTAASAVSLLALALADLSSSYASWWPLLVLLGAGIGATFAPVNSALLGSAPAHRTSVAGAVGQLCQQAGTVVGVGALGAAASLVIRARLAADLAGSGLPRAGAGRLAHDLIGNTARASHALGTAIPAHVLQSAVTAGVQRGLLVGAAGFGCGAIAAIFIGAARPAEAPGPAVTEHAAAATAADSTSARRSSADS
jgi:DHA2 family methylenomycin A resistance protein-like MFS transporter